MTAALAPEGEPGGPGVLFLVVGPSGAGKDSLIRAARNRLARSPRFHFPRRVITRPADPASEDFDSVTPAEFDRRRAAGAFCLAWTAHGLSYGVPAAAAIALAAGRSVVVNVSRTVIDEAARRFALLRVVQVTAPDEVLAARLAARGRSSDGDLARRRARRVAGPGNGVALVTIVNDGALEDACARFLAVLGEGRNASWP